MARSAGVGLALLGCFGLIALPGCGSDPGDGSDAEQIRAVLDNYHDATATHDAGLLCADVMAAPPSSSLEECTDIVSAAMRDPRSDLSRSDVLEPLGEPRVTGDTATLRVADGDQRYAAVFERGPSGWRLVLGH